MFGFSRKRDTAASPVIVGGKSFEKVTWWKHGSLIHLHCICAILLLSSATNGFDGSMSRSQFCHKTQQERKLTTSSERSSNAELLARSLPSPVRIDSWVIERHILRGPSGRSTVGACARRWHWSEVDDFDRKHVDLHWRGDTDCQHQHRNVCLSFPSLLYDEVSIRVSLSLGSLPPGSLLGWVYAIRRAVHQW